MALYILPSPGGGLPAAVSQFYRDATPLGLPLAFYVILVILLAWYLLRQTRYGRYLYAVGGHPDAAYATGVPVNAVQFSTYVISGLMSALAGIAITLLTCFGQRPDRRRADPGIDLGGRDRRHGAAGRRGWGGGRLDRGGHPGFHQEYHLFRQRGPVVADLRQRSHHRPGAGSPRSPISGQEEAPVKNLWLRKLSISPPLAAVLLAVVLFLLSGLLPNGYGSNPSVALAQATNIMRLSVFLGVIAAGQTLVIISGGEGIDLSVGAVVTLTAILVYTLCNGRNSMVLPALLVALVVGAIIGLLNGVGVIFLKISPLVMTLGMSGVITGLILVAQHGNVSGAVAPVMTRIIARPLVFGIPGAIIIWIVFAGLMWLLLERTAFGKSLFAIGVNRTTARLSGINVTGMVLATYALAGMLSGLGGFLVVGNTGVVFINLGNPFLFPSIAAVAVGGTLLSGGKGSYLGTMAGALVLTLITSLLTTMQMPDSVRRMVLGATLLVLISIYGRQRGFRQ